MWDIWNRTSMKLWGVWDERTGWITHEGQVIVSKDPGELDDLASHIHGFVRRFRGFISVEDTFTTDPQQSYRWRVRR